MKKDEIVRYFGGNAGAAVKRLSADFFEEMTEIRLRVNRPAAVSLNNEVRYITADGQLTYSPEFGITADSGDLRTSFEAVCRYSVHSFRREIAEGFVTVCGGHRAGFCGTAVTNGNSIESIKDISSLNFRIARQVRGCAEELCGRVFGDNFRGLCSLLIAGAPASGKTTLLRDTARLLGRRFRVALIDERGELAAVTNGVPQNDVGINTDVFDGYSKPAGIMTALRVMSPQIIICDEIGSEEDFKALYTAANSGVYVAATVHASAEEELKRRGFPLELFRCTAFLAGCGKYRIYTGGR